MERSRTWRGRSARAPGIRRDRLVARPEFRYHCLTQRTRVARNKERLRRVLITEVGCPVTVTAVDREPDRGGQSMGRARTGLEYLVDNGCTRRRWPGKAQIHYEPR
jgi:hypothetical protein